MNERDVNGVPRIRYAEYLLSALILGTILYVRLRLLSAPPERDEGEYAYMGQLMLKGLPPFANAYTMKLPGVSFMYAFFFSTFGESPEAIHLGLLLVNLLSIFLIYLLARRLLGGESALVSCVTYAVLSLSYSVLGVFAHATHFVVLFALAGFVLLLRSLEKGRMVTLFFSGICFGAAVIMKQHAALILCFAFFYLLRRGWKDPDPVKKRMMAGGGLFLFGAILPYLLVVLYLYFAGAFDQFWFWTVTYAREYVSEMTPAQGWRYFSHNFEPIVTPQLPFWLMAALGGLFLCFRRGRAYDRLFFLGLFISSLLALCPGWYFRPHYFVMLLPAVALLAGSVTHPSRYLLTFLKLGRFQQFVPTALLVMAAAYGCHQEWDYYFIHAPRQVSRACYGLSPFPEAVVIAGYLKAHTSPADRVAILGSEPEILFHADRISATRHIYMYGLMENHPYAPRMQQEMIREIEQAKPKYMVMVNIVSSWFALAPVTSAIIEWGEKYARENYDVVGVIDMIDYDTTIYRWDGQATGYKATSPDFLTVLKRKERSR